MFESGSEVEDFTDSEKRGEESKLSWSGSESTYKLKTKMN